ncbi:MAG: polyprenyl synthetase family protein [Formosimonas sp.]
MMALQGDAVAFEAWANGQRPLIEARLQAGLAAYASSAAAEQSPLLAAMRHGVLNGGKRVRALAVLAAGEWLGVEAAILLDVAAALEYMHAYSLIHDDLPCMDDDDLRRGQPTVHVLFGQAQALLAGDALQTLAFATLTELNLDAATQVRLLRELARASGIAGMAGGQAIDLHHVGQTLSQADMQTMHALKTGALLTASLRMGALCAPNQALDAYANHLGLLFQVVDDILDASQNTAVLGKTAGKDDAANKPTYVRALGIDGARAYAQRLYAAALAALPVEQAQRLADLAAYCATRAY